MSESKFKPPAYIFVENPPVDVWCRSCRTRHKMLYEYQYNDVLTPNGFAMRQGTLLRAIARCPRQNIIYAVMLRSKEVERREQSREKEEA